jgi:hypothetical protein
MKKIALAAALVASACTAGDPASPLAEHGELPAERAAPLPSSGPSKNVVELFETRLLPTCSLNGGVCHNSRNYPDMRDLGALEDLVDLPCGMNVDHDFPDACEPRGDRIVVDGIDAEILRVASDGTITVDADVPSTPSGAVIRRTLRSGTWERKVGAPLARIAEKTLLVDGDDFFRPSLPLRDDHVWPADVNGNGILGASLGWREIVPGRPDKSWMVARLWDTDASPELMPRQCRAWNDDATRALGCWVQGLRPDASNFYDDIDWARCTFEVTHPGRCGTR